MIPKHIWNLTRILPVTLAIAVIGDGYWSLPFVLNLSALLGWNIGFILDASR